MLRLAFGCPLDEHPKGKALAMALVTKPLADSAGAEAQDIAALILFFCWPNFREELVLGSF